MVRYFEWNINIRKSLVRIKIHKKNWKRAFQNKGKKRSAELKNQQQKQRATHEHS